MIVQVALDVPIARLFDYQVPDGVVVQKGQRVLVPFGPRKLVGVVVAHQAHSDVALAALKPLHQVLDDTPVLPPAILDICDFVADYYCAPLGQVLSLALPLALRQARALPAPPPLAYQKTLLLPASESIPSRQKLLRALLSQFAANAVIQKSAIDAQGTGMKRALGQAMAAQWLEPVYVLPSVVKPSTAPALNADQVAAITQINAAQGFVPFLLFGITGSGKTEVYLHAIAEQLAQNKQVLLLVPEINLTPQLVERIQARFVQEQVLALHSNLAEVERLLAWQAAASGRARIVIGTRLAVFTPMPLLGLIIVDEEHDSAFKQQDGVRYSARDVAVYRAQQAGLPIVLGSATPSLESYHNAQQGRYHLLRLSQRAGDANLASIRLLDVRHKPLSHGLSAPLLEAIQTRLDKQEQSLLFINRRGYAPVLACHACAWVAQCQRCSVSLVVHLQARQVRCHHCGHQAHIPSVCPSCGNPDLSPLGQGTQKVEDFIRQRFPAARIARVDADSVSRKQAWQTLYEGIQAREYDILIGTQMLAKGHDFPALTLVGILNADAGLYSADYRAQEQLFAQLMQVAGRAGRGQHAGEVLVQTKLPEHVLYQALQQQNYPIFADAQLAERHMASFPPVVYQLALRAEAVDVAAVRDFLTQAANWAKQYPLPITVFDPTPASVAKVAGKQREHLLLQHPQRKGLRQFARDFAVWLRAGKQKKVRWVLDVDPLGI